MGSMSSSPGQPAKDAGTQLVCRPCTRLAPHDGRGWRALHGLDERGEVELVFVCPTCWTTEFKGRPGSP